MQKNNFLWLKTLKNTESARNRGEQILVLLLLLLILLLPLLLFPLLLLLLVLLPLLLLPLILLLLLFLLLLPALSLVDGGRDLGLKKRFLSQLSAVSTERPTRPFLAHKLIFFKKYLMNFLIFKVLLKCFFM